VGVTVLVGTWVGVADGVTVKVTVLVAVAGATVDDGSGIAVSASRGANIPFGKLGCCPNTGRYATTINAAMATRLSQIHKGTNVPVFDLLIYPSLFFIGWIVS
jgi:hypothetical protein